MNIKKLIVALAILGTGSLIFITSSKQEEQEITEKNTTRRVQTATVSEINNSATGAIFAYGQVVSVTGIDVVPEINGVVSRVNKTLGSVVRPGDVIVSLQNNSQAQQVAQAQASLAQAQAQLAKVSKDADASTIAQAESALVASENALAQTEQNTLNSLDSLYSNLKNLVTTGLDSRFFSNVNTNFPDVKFEIEVNSDEIALEQMRAQVETNFDLDRSYNDVNNAVDQFNERISDVGQLAQQTLIEINKLKPGASLSENTLDSYKADIALVQDQLASFTSQTKTLETSLADRRQAVVSAELQVQDVRDGADDEDILSAQASVAQAQASLLSAQIAFGKTQITAPVFGTISNTDVKVGQLVGPSAPVFSIANENALRIDTSVTAAEARKLQVGDTVLVDNEYDATLSVISSSVEEGTGRVKVQILLQDQDVTLVSGSGVGLVFTLDNSLDSVDANDDISIPIESVFVRGGKSYVYVLQDNKAVPQEIVTNSLFGDNIKVQSGLSASDVIILSARGVKDNETVEVITK